MIANASTPPLPRLFTCHPSTPTTCTGGCWVFPSRSTPFCLCCLARTARLPPPQLIPLQLLSTSLSPTASLRPIQTARRQTATGFHRRSQCSLCSGHMRPAKHLGAAPLLMVFLQLALGSWAGLTSRRCKSIIELVDVKRHTCLYSHVQPYHESLGVIS